jgi:hypothetical protein
MVELTSYEYYGILIIGIALVALIVTIITVAVSSLIRKSIKTNNNEQ